jgi:hypothetical protein
MPRKVLENSRWILHFFSSPVKKSPCKFDFVSISFQCLWFFCCVASEFQRKGIWSRCPFLWSQWLSQVKELERREHLREGMEMERTGAHRGFVTSWPHVYVRIALHPLLVRFVPRIVGGLARLAVTKSSTGPAWRAVWPLVMVSMVVSICSLCYSSNDYMNWCLIA